MRLYVKAFVYDFIRKGFFRFNAIANSFRTMSTNRHACCTIHYLK